MLNNSASGQIPPLPAHVRFSREFQLLAACSWIAPPGLQQLQADAIADQLDAEIDWQRLIELTERHRVQALTHSGLSRHAPGQVPEKVLQQLKERSQRCRMQALLNAAELTRLSRLFADNNIRVMPLKGVALSLRLFGDVGIRQARDLDLLIQPHDLDRACRILEAEGYRNNAINFTMTAKQQRSFIRHFHHFEFVHSTGLCVELHWNLYAWPTEQVESLWRESLADDFAGAALQHMDDDTLLLMLCDHGAKHAWFRLKWLSDIVMLLMEDRPQGWESLIARAEELDLKRTLAQAALLVRWIYGIPLAEELATVIREEKRCAALCKPALEGLQKGAADLESFGKRMEGLQAVLQIWQRRPSLSWRTVLMPILTQPADYRDFPLPDSLFWLYIPLRPFLWLRRHYMK